MANRTRYFGNMRSQPEWAGDFGGREHILAIPAKIDPSQFNDGNSIKVVVGAAGAAANATSIPVDAIALPNNPANVTIMGNNIVIPAGATLYFGASKKLALVTAAVALGATSVAVQALPTALVDRDTAYYPTGGTNQKAIPSGTIVGRTYAERDSNTPFGLGIDTDDELFITVFDIPDANAPGGDECELYRHGGIVKENYLPTVPTGGLLTKIRALYRCIKGVD